MRITIGGVATIAQGATVSDAMATQERPLAWISLPADWPADAPVTLQGCISQSDTPPQSNSADWQTIVNAIGQPITLTGTAGQIVALQEGVFLGMPWLRLRIGTAAAAARSIAYCVRWVRD